MTQRHAILATAGHIDHGKSSLVKALSGTDPDQLPEEKARGMTIDLGVAHNKKRHKESEPAEKVPRTSEATSMEVPTTAVPKAIVPCQGASSSTTGIAATVALQATIPPPRPDSVPILSADESLQFLLENEKRKRAQENNAVVIEAQHLCMQMRGVEKQHSSTTTSAFSGIFMSDEKTRSEFINLIK